MQIQGTITAKTIIIRTCPARKIAFQSKLHQLIIRLTLIHQKGARVVC